MKDLDKIALALVATEDSSEYNQEYVSGILLGRENGSLSEVLDVVNDIQRQYEEIGVDLVAGGSTSYFNSLQNEAIYKEKESGKFYKVTWTHDSWTDSSLSDANIEIKEVFPVEKTMTVYE